MILQKIKDAVEAGPTLRLAWFTLARYWVGSSSKVTNYMCAYMYSDPKRALESLALQLQAVESCQKGILSGLNVLS